MSQRPFRFGVLNRSAPSRAEWHDLAHKAEDLGYSTFLVSDHFLGQFSMGAALVSAADATSRIRVGSLVYDTDFRHPAVLAKEAATIDLLTDGRFELGLGAGWMLSDYEQTGIHFDPPAVRFRRFSETLTILKGLFGNAAFSFEGGLYAIDRLDGQPKPVQKPHMPIVIGAGGRRMLQLAAREANIVSILMQAERAGGLSFSGVSSASFDDKLRVVRQAAGERYGRLEINLLMQRTVVTGDRQQAATDLGGQWQIPVESVLDCPLALIGSVDQIEEELQRRRERWDASYVCVFRDAMDSFAPVVARLTDK